jgi:hypothetical protein
MVLGQAVFGSTRRPPLCRRRARDRDNQRSWTGHRAVSGSDLAARPALAHRAGTLPRQPIKMERGLRQTDGKSDLRAGILTWHALCSRRVNDRTR